MKFRRRLKIYALLFLSLANLLVWTVVWAEADRNLRVYFLDVGQGDAVLIRAPGGNKILIDAGPDGAALKALADIFPFHDRRLNVLIATHPDQDHIGGFVQILSRYDSEYYLHPGIAGSTRTAALLDQLVEQFGLETVVARRGQKIHLGGGAVLEILFPDRDVSGLNPNDGSIVAKLSFGRTTFLLTGDSPKKIEEYLAFLDGGNLQSDILKVGHHGSKTSTSREFLLAVRPRLAVISAGRDNRYGHPHPEVLEILEQQGVKTLGTYDWGTIFVKSDGRRIKVRDL